MSGQPVTVAALQRIRMDEMLDALRGLEQPPGTRRLIYNISRWPAEATATFLALIESARRGPYPEVGINDDPVLTEADRAT